MYFMKKANWSFKELSMLFSIVYSVYLDDSVYSTDHIQENYLKCNKNNVIQD